MNRAELDTYAALAGPAPDERRGRFPETPAEPSQSLDVTYPGVPVAMGRPRAGKGFHGRPTLHTPERSRQAQHSLRYFLLDAARAQGWTVTAAPVFVLLEFGFAPPKSWPKWKLDAMDYLAHTQKPDVDNLVKLVKDAANLVLWHDDAQAVSLYARKVWADTPYTRLQVERQPEGPKSAAEWKALTLARRAG